MEEKKLNQNMGVATPKEEGKTEKQQKLTYEQLNEVCSQLYQENQRLIKQLQQSNMTNMFKRLDYLFAVLQYENVIKDPEFITSCVDEIKAAMAIPAEDDKEKEE